MSMTDIYIFMYCFEDITSLMLHSASSKEETRPLGPGEEMVLNLSGLFIKIELVENI